MHVHESIELVCPVYVLGQNSLTLSQDEFKQSCSETNDFLNP